EPAQLLRDGLGARAVIGERVVVEEVLLHLREVALGERDLLRDVIDGPRAIALAADRLWPQAEGALRAAPAAGVERDVGMLQVADEIVLDRQVTLVDIDHEWQGVHVLEDGTLRRVAD